MNETAGKFNLTIWNEPLKDIKDTQAKSVVAQTVMTFTGGLNGEVHADYLMMKNVDETHYGGMMTFTGEVDGRRGSFLARVWGEYIEDTATTHFEVIRDSGTDQLAQLKGRGVYKAKASREGEVKFSYELPASK